MPRAEYVIDIATNMPAGEQTIAELDRITANLMGAGKGAEHFQQALVQVSNALDAAKAASAAANAALAEGNAEYKLLEKAALQAAKAEEKAALRGAVPPSLARAALESAAALGAHADQLRVLERHADTAAKKEDDLARAFGNIKKISAHVDKSISSNAEALGTLRGGLSAIGGPIGSLGAKLAARVKDFTELSGSLGAANASALLAAVGIGGVAIAAVALTAALVAGVGSVAAWSVGLSDANRSTQLTRDALEAMRPELVGLRGAFADLHAETGAHANELAGYAGNLKEMKVAAADIPDALRAIALSEAALGKGGAADFIAELKAGKRSAADLSREVNGKLGPIVQKQMQGLTAQSAKFHDEIGNLFGGLNVDPALRGLERLVGLFGANTAAGRAIKFLFESVFQPLINQADKAAIAIEAFALGFLTGMVKLYIAAKPAVRALAELFGFSDPTSADTLAMLTKAGEYVAPVIAVAAAAFVALGAAAGVLVGAVVAIQVAVYAMAAGVVYAGVVVVQGVMGAWDKVANFLGSLTLQGVGSALMKGFALGLTGGAGEVIAAIVGTAKSAITAAKNALGIHSPSREFFSIGGFTTEGMVDGLDAGAKDVQASMAALSEPPDASALAAQDRLSGGLGAGGGGATNTSTTSNSASRVVSNNVFNFHGVQGAADALDMLREQFTLLLEGDAAAAGGGVPA